MKFCGTQKSLSAALKVRRPRRAAWQHQATAPHLQNDTHRRHAVDTHCGNSTSEGCHSAWYPIRVPVMPTFGCHSRWIQCSEIEEAEQTAHMDHLWAYHSAEGRKHKCKCWAFRKRPGSHGHLSHSFTTYWSYSLLYPFYRWANGTSEHKQLGQVHIADSRN